MSRAINLNLTREQAVAAVAKEGAVLSAIEPLHPTGMRIVLTNAEHAATLRRKLKPKLITKPVTRTPLRTR